MSWPLPLERVPCLAGPSSRVTHNRLEAQASSRLPLIGLAAVLGLVLLVGGIVWLNSGPRKSRQAERPNEDNTSPTQTQNQPSTVAEHKGPGPDQRPLKPNPRLPETATVPELLRTIRTEIRPVGRYVSLPRWGPSLLLQRPGEAYPWTPLRPEGTILSSQTLVSLPGYRSVIALGREEPPAKAGDRPRDSWKESGIHLGLWGNLPEFSAFPPVQESVVMVNLPGPGVDLDLILDRGRIHIANQKAKAPVQVRLRFLSEVWDLTLPGTESEVCAELWTLPAQATASTGQPTTRHCLGLFTKGPVRLTTPKQQIDLPSQSRVSWLSGGVPSGQGPAQLRRDTLQQLPDWWIKPVGSGSPQAADAMLSLLDWQKALASSSEVLDRTLTEVRESKDPTSRVIGLLFLAALNGQQYLLDFLEDRQHSEVRGAAAHALRTWLTQNSHYSAEIARLLQEKRGYSRDKAKLVVELLQPFSQSALGKPETYQRLINALNHENLAVRELAYWHLAHRIPEGARTIRYDPVGTVEERRQALEQWRKLIPPGKVPDK